MNSCNIIEKVVIEHARFTTAAARDYAIVMGEDSYPKPFFFRNIDTGEEYHHLIGGFAWPGTKPGFAVIVAVERTEDPNPGFKVVEEIEEDDVERLVLKCLALQEKYGGRGTLGTLNCWYGDPEHPYAPIASNMNRRLSNNGGDFLVIPPPDHDLTDRFELYAKQVQSCLLPDEQGVKRLFLGNCDMLRGYISQVSVKDGTKNAAADQPAVAALGHAIHTLLRLEPWRECLDAEESYWDCYHRR